MPEEKTPAHHGTHDGKFFCHCHSGKHGVLLIVSVQFNMIDLNYKKIRGKVYKDLFAELFHYGDRICISYEDLSDNLAAETASFTPIPQFDLLGQVKKYYTPLEFDKHCCYLITYNIRDWVLKTNSLKELLDIYQIHEITVFKCNDLLFRGFSENIAQLYDDSLLNEETAAITY